MRSRTRDMTEGVIWKQLLLYAIPLILGDILQQLYNTADSIIVGRFISKQALAAVTSTSTIVNTLVGLFTGISMGATIVIARHFGARDRQKLQETVETTLVLTVILSAVLTWVGVAGTPLMLHLLATPDDVYSSALVYLRVYFAGVSGLILYNMMSGILRAVGDTKRPLYSLAVTSLLNIMLDLLFVIVLKMDVMGAALATVLSQFASAILLTYFVCGPGGLFRLRLQDMKIHREPLVQILASGLPIGIQKSLVAASNTVVVAKINTFGSGAMAAWGVYRKLDQLVMHIAQNVSLAVSAFVSQNIGAGKTSRLKEGVRVGLGLALSVTMSIHAVLLLARYPVIGLFNQDSDVLTYGAGILLQTLPLHFASVIANVQGGDLRGRGNSTAPMVFTMLSNIVLRQLYLHIGWLRWPELWFVVSSYPFGWFCNMLLTTVYRAWWLRRKGDGASVQLLRESVRPGSRENAGTDGPGGLESDRPDGLENTQTDGPAGGPPDR